MKRLFKDFSVRVEGGFLRFSFPAVFPAATRRPFPAWCRERIGQALFGLAGLVRAFSRPSARSRAVPPAAAPQRDPRAAASFGVCGGFLMLVLAGVVYGVLLGVQL